MRIFKGSNGIRVLFAGIAGGAAIGAMALFGGGTASADTTCSAADNNRVERADGLSHCIANAGPGSRADARDTSDSGVATAVSTQHGTATSVNLQPQSQALSSGVRGGDAYSFSTGPRSTSISMARDGGTSVAVGGWGGQAYAGPEGAVCAGGFGAAYDSNTGQYCVKSGSIDIH
ncbi:hypothetical protein L5I01_08110 [Gordonia sp. HY442]|uniref:DUF6764 family protein n=1 Tax=Gordonia zhenghanii TaxID=2911516 RepID=UPI001F172C94|nr:DUF6764 family protein [Gordonia zhenghanii]MCF8603323.1 hypothetical protein [Gordonia zhenghanii]